MLLSQHGSSDEHGQHSLDDPVSSTSTTTYRHATSMAAAGPLSLSVPATSAASNTVPGGAAIPATSSGRNNPTSLSLPTTAGGDPSRNNHHNHPARNLTLPTSGMHPGLHGGNAPLVGGGLKDGGVVPSSMMLWKKVQHCVVYGGSFVSAAKESGMRRPRRATSGITRQNEIISFSFFSLCGFCTIGMIRCERYVILV